MQDFDTDRIPEREFRIGGQTFRCKGSLRPEALIEWVSVQAETDPLEAIHISDRLIVQFLHSDDVKRWQALRAREDDPISMRDLNAIAAWLVSNEAGRPTEAPSSSTDGRENGGTNSTVTSSTEPAAESAA